jgi:DNA-binding response OmpR family regulator
MGLAFIKQIIRLLPGSKIDFKSEEGKGSVFIVTFKKEIIKKTKKEKLITQIQLTKPISRKKAIINKTIQHDDKKKTVLIIDDNMELLSLLQASMGGIFNVYVATDGVEALRLLQIIPRPDLIILDILMQPIDGFQFLDQFKKIESMNDICVIFLTAKNNTIDILNGFQSGAIDYICKPLKNIDELNEKIQSLLRFKDRFRENITKRLKKNVDDAFVLPDNVEDKIKQKFSQLAYKYRLTDQQTKVMWYAKDNMSNEEIGKLLCISPGTVGSHIQDIRKKCNTKTKQKLIQKFREAITV